MILDKTILLNEFLRPKTIEELNLPSNTIASLARLHKSNVPMNMIFYGSPGIGKTSAARILVENCDCYEFNGSHSQGDKTLLKSIDDFSSTVSLFSRPKVVFIDEADQLSVAVQDALRYKIESASRNARFILTANDFRKLTNALKSRCVSVNFDVAPKDRAEVIERMVGRYQIELAKIGIEADPQRLAEITGTYFPDLRAVANQIEFELAA